MFPILDQISSVSSVTINTFQKFDRKLMHYMYIVQCILYTYRVVVKHIPFEKWRSILLSKSIISVM